MKAIGCIAFIVIAILLGLVLAAVVVGIVAAWFLDTPFRVGWDAAWDQVWKLFVFEIVAGTLLGASRLIRD